MRAIIALTSFLCLTAIPCAAVKAQSVPRITEQGELGGASRSGGVEFGLPQGVELDGSRVWVIDRHNRNVQLIDTQSRRSWAIGRMGRGPGEFMEPVAVALVAPGRVAVLDRANGRISIIEAGEEAEVTTTIPVSIAGADGLCVQDEKLFVLGAGQAGIVHELDMTGRANRSFGRPFRSETPQMAALSNRGEVLCMAAGARTSQPAIIVASEEFGIVQAYAMDGSLLWNTVLPDFRPIAVSFPAAGAVRYSLPEEGSYHVLVSLFTVDGGDVVVQVGEVDDRNVRREEVVEVTSYVLSTADGSVKASSDDLPRVDRVRGAVGAGIDNSFVPRIRLFRVQR